MNENMNSRKQIEPLRDLDEVLCWNPPEFEPYDYPDCYQRSSFFLAGDTWRSGDRSWDSLVSSSLVRSQGGHAKTLLCHDMMGGYLEDRFNQGFEGETADTGYHFRHWANIDYFVYFSHHFVTLPPVGWIAAARCHFRKSAQGKIKPVFAESTESECWALSSLSGGRASSCWRESWPATRTSRGSPR